MISQSIVQMAGAISHGKYETLPVMSYSDMKTVVLCYSVESINVHQNVTSSLITQK